MTKRVHAKYKIDRRLGENIWGRPKSPVNKREYGPGQHGQRRKGKLSDFGHAATRQAEAKGYYGNITERQFHGIYGEAARLKGDTSENLIGLLERRLDAIVYRAKFVPTVFAARQFVSHGQSGSTAAASTSPSYRCKRRRRGRGARRRPRSSRMVLEVDAELAERDVPDYIEVDHSKMTAKFFARPTLSRRALSGA